MEYGVFLEDMNELADVDPFHVPRRDRAGAGGVALTSGSEPSAAGFMENDARYAFGS